MLLKFAKFTAVATASFCGTLAAIAVVGVLASDDGETVRVS